METTANTLKICVICCAGFDSASTVQSDAVLCREHLVSFCKLLANSPPRQHPDLDALIQKSFPGMDAFFEESGMSVCVDCHHQITVAMEKGTEAEKKEEEVRKLQLQILQQMKELQKQVEEFHEEMTKVEKVIQTSDVSCLMYHMAKNPSKNEDVTNGIVLIRDRILDVMADLRDFQARQNDVLNVDLHLAQLLAAASNPEDIDDDFIPYIPQPEVIIGTEGFLEAGKIAPMFIGHTIFSDEGDFRFEASDKNNRTMGDPDYSKSDEASSVDSVIDEDHDTAYRPHRRVKRALGELKRRGRPQCVDLTSSRVASNTPSKTTVSFKKEIIDRCLRNKKNRKKEDANSLDPIVRYPLQYHPNRDKFTIGRHEILVDEDSQTLKCATCGFYNKEGRRRGSLDLEWKMKVHIVAVHIGFNCAAPRCYFTAADHGQFIRHIRSVHHKNNNNRQSNGTSKNLQISVSPRPTAGQSITKITTPSRSSPREAPQVQYVDTQPVQGPAVTPTKQPEKHTLDTSDMPPSKHSRTASSATRQCPVSSCKQLFSSKEGFIKHLQLHRNKLQRDRPKPKPKEDDNAEPELVILD